MTWFAVFASFWPFLNKECQKYGEGMIPSKGIKDHIWTHHTQIPVCIPISFHYLGKIFRTWKSLHSHSGLKALTWSSCGVNFISECGALPQAWYTLNSTQPPWLLTELKIILFVYQTQTVEDSYHIHHLTWKFSLSTPFAYLGSFLP